MSALTRFESTTPVRYDVMNAMCDEIDEQFNDLNGKFSQPTVTLYNGWTTLDSVAIALKNGTLLKVYARLQGGIYTANTKILSVANVATGMSNQFFSIKSTIDGITLGTAYMNTTGDIYILTDLTTNADILIDWTFINLGGDSQ